MTIARALGLPVLPSLLGVLAATALPALATAGQHTTLASFQAATRGNTLLEPFNGPDNLSLPPIAVTGNGFAYTVTTTGAAVVTREAAFGVGAAFSADATRLVFAGRPASAIAGRFFAVNQGGASVAETIQFLTDTGESFSVAVPVGGAFFGFTTTRPFTSVTFTANNTGATFETVDDAYVGISASAAEFTDQCADAVTINPITAVQYPFATFGTGATTTAISGSCATIDNGADVWVRFVSPVYGNVTVNTCGASFDTVLRVFDNCGSAGTGVGATQIACNDDFCTGGAGALGSQVQFRAEAGEDYLLRISGFNGQTGTGNLNFSVVPDCQADFNHTGMKDVQDIFDFLNAWFGGC